MKKSIETIWKEGFLKGDALIAPKINDLYNKKSKDLVEKFKRMYKINIIGILLFAFVFLPVSFLIKMQYMGVPMFFLFLFIATYAMKFKKKLNGIDKGLNSYKYLNSFNEWVTEMISFNTKLSRFLYPYVFLSMVLGFWFIDKNGKPFGSIIVDNIIYSHPDLSLVVGIPIILIIICIVVVAFLAMVGGKIGQWDMNLVYGRILRRLKVLLTDMEELRS